MKSSEDWNIKENNQIIYFLEDSHKKYNKKTNLKNQTRNEILKKSINSDLHLYSSMVTFDSELTWPHALKYQQKKMYDPKNPDNYFKVFHALQETSLHIHKTLLGDDENSDVDRFFDEVQNKQNDLISLQKELQKDVDDIENELSKFKSSSQSDSQYHSAISFFQDKEVKLQNMANRMENLASKASDEKESNASKLAD